MSPLQPVKKNDFKKVIHRTLSYRTPTGDMNCLFLWNFMFSYVEGKLYNERA